MHGPPRAEGIESTAELIHKVAEDGPVFRQRLSLGQFFILDWVIFYREAQLELTEQVAEDTDVDVVGEPIVDCVRQHDLVEVVFLAGQVGELSR